MTFGNFWNLEIGNLESARNWLVLANFNILGIFPTQFRSLSLILNSEFQISNFSGIWKLEIWKSGNSQKLISFSPISIYRVFFPLSLGHKTWFWTQNFKFPIFLDFFRKYSGNLEILRNLLFSPISMYGASFPLDFSHCNWFCTQNIKFQSFLDFSSGNFLEIWKLSRVCYVWPISMYGASFSLNLSYWNRFCTHNIKFQHFSGTFPEFSGNLEISGNCIVLVNFNILGIFPT